MFKCPSIHTGLAPRTWFKVGYLNWDLEPELSRVATAVPPIKGRRGRAKKIDAAR